MSQLVFVSSPYSHPDLLVKLQRKRDVTLMVAKMLHLDIFGLSPIVYGLAIISEGINLPDDWEFWKRYCHEYMHGCSSVYVLAMDGWEESAGVAGEIEEARSQDKSIYLIEFDTDITKPIKILKQL